MRAAIAIRQARRPAAVVAALLGLVMMLASPALAARKAFVVGNSAYAHVAPLPNPVNDAGDMARQLQALGYEVTLGLDLTRAQLLARFQQFVRALRREDLALLYFAGHGLQLGGENYLFPVDARLTTEDDAKARLVPLNTMMADLSRATDQRVVILDACRNNPFAEQLAQTALARSGGATRGLARVYAGVGSYIAFSTQPGNVALDGTGRNSPFTAALLRHIATPGADAHAVMRRVRADVQSATRSEQIPWENSSLVQEVSFAATPAGSQPAAAPQEQAQIAQAPSSAVQAQRPAGEAYHFVDGLDPQGDNFLALRSAPDGAGVRLATMGPGTLLRVTESRGAWRHVTLRDGTAGWAHGTWIHCCRSAGVIAAAPAAATPAATAGTTCESLWHRRNAIFHRHRYCFTTEKAQRAFGTGGCVHRSQEAALDAMSEADKVLLRQIAAEEKRLRCR